MQRGEIWWATFRPPQGSEPGCRRPVLVVQGSVANVSQIMTLDKSFLTDRISTLDQTIMKEIDEGLRLVLNI